MKAALSGLASRWRSTQLKQAFSRPPTNHFQNGGLLVSSIVCHSASQVRRSAYSLKQSGKFSSLNRSRMSGSAAFACWTKLLGGSMYSSSRQWTAICASDCSCSVAIFSTSCGKLLCDLAGPGPPGPGPVSGCLCALALQYLHRQDVAIERLVGYHGEGRIPRHQCRDEAAIAAGLADVLRA